MRWKGHIIVVLHLQGAMVGVLNVPQSMVVLDVSQCTAILFRGMALRTIAVDPCYASVRRTTTISRHRHILTTKVCKTSSCMIISNKSHSYVENLVLLQHSMIAIIALYESMILNMMRSSSRLIRDSYPKNLIYFDSIRFCTHALSPA